MENIDSKIIGPVYNALKKYNAFRMLVLPDHYTSIQERTHTSDPVPFATYGTDSVKKSKLSFTESNAKKGIKIENGYELMRHFIKGDIS